MFKKIVTALLASMAVFSIAPANAAMEAITDRDALQSYQTALGIAFGQISLTCRRTHNNVVDSDIPVYINGIQNIWVDRSGAQPVLMAAAPTGSHRAILNITTSTDYKRIEGVSYFYESYGPVNKGDLVKPVIVNEWRPVEKGSGTCVIR